MDEEGIRTNLLEPKSQKSLQTKQKSKFIYVIPNFNSPACITMSMPRRLRLLELAHSTTSLLLKEDDPYGLIFGEDLTHIRQRSNVIYLGTTSKILPLDCVLHGWLPRHFLERINLAKSGSICVPAPLI